MATGFTIMDALNKNSKVGVDESPTAKFRTKDISIFKMYRNTMNFYSVKNIEELAGHILIHGLKQNLEILYDPCELGEYRIVAGERRWEALKYLVSLGYKEFEIATSKLTSPQDADEEQVEIIIANSYRDKTVTDMIEEEQRLKESLERMKAAGKQIKGYELQSGRLRDVIASMLNISKTKIAQIESVSNNLIPEFKEEMDKERLTFSAAYELSGMSTDEQREALSAYMETGELSLKDVKDMKEAKTAEKEAAQIEGQMELDGQRNVIEKAAGQQVSESDTEEQSNKTDNEENSETAGEEYQTPHPDEITSICYSCTEYETCNVKTGTCTTCDQYKSRAEANKTDEQRYSEEQDKIDRETAAKLGERADEKKLDEILTKDIEDGSSIHQIRLAAMYFDAVCSGKKSFELRKNDRHYKEGDILEMMEFKDGRNTGRSVSVLVTFLLEDYTGIEEGFCIMGTSLTNESGEELQSADINQICRNIEANGDGYIEGGEEFILINKAVSMVRDGKI